MDKTFIRVPTGLQFAILSAIPMLGADACGAILAKTLNKNADRKIGTATVYLALSRLNEKGYLNSQAKKVIQGQGRPRRVYVLSATGKQALEAGRKFYGISNGKGKD